MHAAIGGHTHTVEALARAGADLNIGDEVSCSSCSTAVECIAACHYQHCSGGLCPLFTVHTCIAWRHSSNGGYSNGPLRDSACSGSTWCRPGYSE